MIKTKNLKKNYNSLQVLKGVDLNISKAEIVSIVGVPQEPEKQLCCKY